MKSRAVVLKLGQSSLEGHFPFMVGELYCNWIDSFISYVPVEGRSCEFDSHPAFYHRLSAGLAFWGGEVMGEDFRSFKGVLGFRFGGQGEEFLGHGKHGLNCLVRNAMICQCEKPVILGDGR